MKVCPQCKTSYSDETLQFCLQDGSPLVAQTNPETETPTVAFGEQTVGFETTDLDKSYTTKKDAEQVRVHIPDQQTDWGKSQQTRVITQKAESSGSKTLIAVFATALVMLLLFGAGIGAYFFFSNQNGEITQATNKKDDENDDSNTDSVLESSPEPKETKKPTPKENEPEPTEKPEPTEPPAKFNPEEIKKDIEDQIYSWRSLAEARNLNAYMSKYASRIDYYKKKNMSVSSVRADKQKAFSKYEEIDINISQLKIDVDSSGEEATASFDKQWYFDDTQWTYSDESKSKSTSGKVRSQLRFKKIGGDWKITSEKDLKVYYVNR